MRARSGANASENAPVVGVVRLAHTRGTYAPSVERGAHSGATAIAQAACVRLARAVACLLPISVREFRLALAYSHP